MDMTLQDLRNDLGSLINQVDDSGAFVSSSISTAEADRWINEALRDVYLRYALQNKEALTQRGTFNIEDGIDTYTFGGDGVDILFVTQLGVKYTSTDTYFKRVRPMSYPDTQIIGNETYPSDAPVYYRVSKKVSGVPTNGVKLSPEPTEDVTGGAEIYYIEKHPVLVLTTDAVVRLPDNFASLIPYGAAVKAFHKLDLDNRALVMEKMFNGKIEQGIATDQTDSSDTVKRMRLSRTYFDKFYLRR